MSESDREVCGTCGLTWGGIGSSPPCLLLPKDERRAIVEDFYASAPSNQQPEETTYGDYQAAARNA